MRVVSRFLISAALGALLAGCPSPEPTNDASTDTGGSTDATRMDTGSTGDANNGDTGSTKDTGGGSCEANSCGECTPQNGCGWCTTSNTCTSGTETGSDNGACTGSNWIWLPSQCMEAQDECAMHSGSCDDCTMQPACGWCPGMGCFAGTGDGPYMNGMQSTCGGWAWLNSECTGAPDGGGPDGDMPDVPTPDVVLPDVVSMPDTGAAE